MKTFEKILAGMFTIFVIRKAVQHPKETVYVLKFFFVFFIAILLLGFGMELKEYLENPPLEQVPGESSKHRDLRQMLKDEGYGPERYEYKNNPEVHN